MPRRKEKRSETREEGGVVRCHGGERSVEGKGGKGGSMVGVWEREKGSILSKYFIFYLFTVGNELRILSDSSQFSQES